MINPSTKTVFVDHDIDAVSADDIANALTKQGFLARVKIDAMEAIMGVTKTSSWLVFRRIARYEEEGYGSGKASSDKKQ